LCRWIVFDIIDAMSGVISVELLDPAAAADPGLVEQLTALVNDVYAASEQGLWLDEAMRTTPSEMAALIEAGQIAVATLRGRLAGSVRVQVLSEVTGEFGLLAADPEHRGIGVGRELVAFAERISRERGLRAMQLELLVPCTWSHPSKRFLDEWYRRMGYEVIRRTSVDELQPELAPLLATPCEFVVYEKALNGSRDSLSAAKGGVQRAE
jgi:GNAT superfamily N-acetyltransferase